MLNAAHTLILEGVGLSALQLWMCQALNREILVLKLNPPWVLIKRLSCAWEFFYGQKVRLIDIYEFSLTDRYIRIFHKKLYELVPHLLEVMTEIINQTVYIMNPSYSLWSLYAWIHIAWMEDSCSFSPYWSESHLSGL